MPVLAYDPADALECDSDGVIGGGGLHIATLLSQMSIFPNTAVTHDKDEDGNSQKLRPMLLLISGLLNSRTV